MMIEDFMFNEKQITTYKKNTFYIIWAIKYIVINNLLLLLIKYINTLLRFLNYLDNIQV